MKRLIPCPNYCFPLAPNVGYEDAPEKNNHEPDGHMNQTTTNDGTLRENGRNLGLLLLRVVFGTMMVVAHGWPKFAGWAERSQSFFDPFGVGSAASLALTIGAEVVCAALIVVGLGTRFVAIPLIIAMTVALFLFHAGDTLRDREMAILFLGAFSSIALLGPGTYSLDALIRGRRG